MLISQDFFDDTLLECQELFEYSNDQAVQETITELQQSIPSSNNGGNEGKSNIPIMSQLEHLSLTHPESQEGRYDRKLQHDFASNLNGDSSIVNVKAAIVQLQEASRRLEKKEEDPSHTTNDSQDTLTTNNHMLMYWSIILQKDLWPGFLSSLTDNSDDVASILELVMALFPDTLQFHPIGRTLKVQIAPTWFMVNKNGDVPSTYNWFQLLQKSMTTDPNGPLMLLPLLQVARKLCNGCEHNKKAFVNAAISYHAEDSGENGLELLVKCIPVTTKSEDDDTVVIREVCQLIAILGKFQPLAESQAQSGGSSSPQAPTVSSAHANVKELHKAGAVPRLHRLAKQNSAVSQGDSFQLQRGNLLCDALAALRVMAIDNDIVQNMIALGILDTIHDSLDVVVQESSSSSSTTQSSCLPLATAIFGLVRNLCANDEVKTSICKSSLPSILHVMQNYLNDPNDDNTTRSASTNNKNRAVLQEHACGILGAMALRQPINALAIVEFGNGTSNDGNNETGGGHVLILQAMKTFPEKTTLQRQACLALRNIASRLSEDDKAKLLEAGAEDIIQSIAGRHPASSEEAYSALRDLGCNPVMWDVDEHGKVTTKSSTQQFGTVQSNFRAVYDD
ncbi:hypothetical protein IV203_033917 [Nitzschia inconspicua]|uniref:Uncharacterized protein n=1 Tax=Nitzschia inconspicua TaxID=303405 RepID=A0A9K3M2Q9_9STRA|nr:hypothetical protein IV203_033917 [Nitzschia inconspicua]